jgi:hypothetical protein
MNIIIDGKQPRTSRVGLRRMVVYSFLFTVCILPLPALAQIKTTVTDNLLGPDGSPAAGTISISAAGAFRSADGYNVAQGWRIQVPVSAGNFSVNLIPNQGATPSGQNDSYTVTYNLTSTLGTSYWSETWFVPSTGPVGLSIVRTLPVFPANFLASQSPNTILSGPANGSTIGAATFRGLVGADLPLPTATSPGGVESVACTGGQFVNQISTAGVPACQTPTGGVTSVGLSLPSIFSMTGTPVTGSGTLTATLSSQTANQFFASPNGSAGIPGFRSLVAADFPALITSNTTGNAATATALAATPSQCGTNNFSTGVTAAGNANCAQLSASNLLNGVTGSGAAVLQTGAKLGSPSLGIAASPITETWTVGAGGVTQNTLVMTDSGNPSLIIAATSGGYGIAQASASSSSAVEVARYGTASCLTDTGGAVAGDLAISGTGTANYCKDSGQTSSSGIPLATRIIGVFRSSATAGNAALVELTPAHFGTNLATSSLNATTINGGSPPAPVSVGGWNSSGQPINSTTITGTRYAVDYASGSSTNGINEAFASFGSAPACGTVIAPPGAFTITSTVIIGDASNVRYGCRLIGQGNPIFSSTGSGTTIKWGGATNGTMMEMVNCQGCYADAFGLNAEGLAGEGFALMPYSYQDKIEDLSISYFTGSPGYGIYVGTSGTAEVSESTFEKVFMLSGVVGVYHQGSATINIHYRDFSIAEMSTSCFNFQNGNIESEGNNCYTNGTGGISANWVIGNSVNKFVGIDDYSEAVGTGGVMFSMPGAEYCNGPAIVLIGGNYACSASACEIVNYTQNGTLTLIGNNFSTGNVAGTFNFSPIGTASNYTTGTLFDFGNGWGSTQLVVGQYGSISTNTGGYGGNGYGPLLSQVMTYFNPNYHAQIFNNTDIQALSGKVLGQSIEATDPTSLAGQTLNDPLFADGTTYWGVTGGWTIGSGVATYSGVSGTLTQTAANLAIAGVGNAWYAFTYTVSSTGAGTATLTSAFASSTSQVILPMTPGTHTIYFMSTGTPANFVINENQNNSFSLSNFSLKQIAGGNLIANGQVISRVATGTAPLVVSSTTPVANLSIGGNAATATTATSATTAGNLTGTPALPNGTTATTQTTGDSSNDLATDAFVANSLAVGDCDPLNFTMACLEEDFLVGSTNSGYLGKYGWTNTQITSACTVGAAGPFAWPLIGGLNISTTATSGDGCWISLARGITNNLGTDVTWNSTFSYSAGASSGLVYRIGYATAVTSTDVPAAEFDLRYDPTLASLATATYVSGGIVTGTTGETCNVAFNGGTATGTIALTGTNSISGGAFTITSAGAGYNPSAPTSRATLSNGTANCSGQLTISSTANAASSGGDTALMLCVATENGLPTCQSTGTSPDTNAHKVTIGSSVSGTISMQLDSGTTYTFCASGCSVTVPTGPSQATSLTPAFEIISETATTSEVLVARYWRFKATGLSGL